MPGGIGEAWVCEPPCHDPARTRDDSRYDTHGRAGAAQAAHLLTMDAGEEADTAVRLLLAGQGKIVLGHIDIEFA